MSNALTQFTFADPDRFRHDFNAAQGQEVITLLAVGDPALMERQVNAFLSEQVFVPDGPLSRGITDPYWNIGDLSATLGLGEPGIFVYAGPADNVGDLTWDAATIGPGVTHIDASALHTQQGALYIGDDNVSLASIDLSMLSETSEDGDSSLSIEFSPALTSIDLTSLSSLGSGGIIIYENPLLTALDLSSLVASVGQVDIEECDVLASIDVSALATVGDEGIIFDALAAITTLDLSSLTSCGAVNIQNNDLLVSVDLSSLAVVAEALSIVNNPSLTTVSLPSLVDFTLGASLNDNALSQASVDAVLVTLASLDGTGGKSLYENQTVFLEGGTNATPGSSGLTAKATLEDRGCTVLVN